MSSKLTRTIIGALVAIALAVAVSYGLISQQTADQIQTQTDRTLSDGANAPAPGQSAPGQPAPAPQTVPSPAQPDRGDAGSAPRP